MRKIVLLLGVFCLVFVSLQAQDIKVQRYLGKNLKEVSANYGKPVYQDAADSSMICTFYKLPDRNYTFVSDAGGVYQVNADMKFKSKDEAFTTLSNFLKECSETGYSIDTVNTEQYNLHHTGFYMDVKVIPLAEKEKYQIIIAATKNEEE